MKCPYRLEKKFLKNVDNGYMRYKSNDLYENFADCYEDKCPFYSGGICRKVEKECK